MYSMDQKHQMVEPTGMNLNFARLAFVLKLPHAIRVIAETERMCSEPGHISLHCAFYHQLSPAVYTERLYIRAHLQQPQL